MEIEGPPETGEKQHFSFFDLTVLLLQITRACQERKDYFIRFFFLLLLIFFDAHSCVIGSLDFGEFSRFPDISSSRLYFVSLPHPHDARAIKGLKWITHLGEWKITTFEVFIGARRKAGLTRTGYLFSVSR